MGKALSDWEARVRDVLGNLSSSVIGSELIQSAIAEAVGTFSNDRPRSQHADLVGDGNTYLFDLPAGWVVGFSSVTSAEYPQGTRPPALLDLQEVHPYPDNDQATKVMFDQTTPGNTLKVRLTYTIPWPAPTSDPAVDLIASTDFDAVCHLAASYAAGKKAAESASNTRTSFPGADLAGIESESERWRSISSWARKIYDQLLGGGDAPEPPASVVIDWDGMSDFVPLGGRFLTHRRRT